MLSNSGPFTEKKFIEQEVVYTRYGTVHTREARGPPQSQLTEHTHILLNTDTLG